MLHLEGTIDVGELGQLATPVAPAMSSYTSRAQSVYGGRGPNEGVRLAPGPCKRRRAQSSPLWSSFGDGPESGTMVYLD